MVTTRRLVFAGDSITSADCEKDAEGLGFGFGFGFVRKIAECEHEMVLVVNCGASGNRVHDLRHRWQSDVLGRDIDTLTIYIGVNDTWHPFNESQEKTSPTAFRDDYRYLLESAAAAGVRRIILTEPWLLPVSIAQHEWLPDLDEKREIIRSYADEYATGFVPLQPTLSDADNRQRAPLTLDGIHPNESAIASIAESWLRVAREEFDG